MFSAESGAFSALSQDHHLDLQRDVTILTLHLKPARAVAEGKGRSHFRASICIDPLGLGDSSLSLPSASCPQERQQSAWRALNLAKKRQSHEL